MSDCKHDWRHTFDGIECNLCRQTASVGWLIDELSDAAGLLADYRTRLAAVEAERDASDDARREWEVRAAESYARGRAAGLREAAGVLRREAEIERLNYGVDPWHDGISDGLLGGARKVLALLDAPAAKGGE